MGIPLNTVQVTRTCAGLSPLSLSGADPAGCTGRSGTISHAREVAACMSPLAAGSSRC